MNNLLNTYKTINELTADEWEQVQQFWKKKKPSVPFSKATFNDCTRPDGLALDLRYIDGNDVQPTLHIPQEIDFPVPSIFLCKHLLTIGKLFVINNERACRMLIDAILLEVLKSPFNLSLRGLCDVKNDWEGPGFGYTGNVDYILRYSQYYTVKNTDGMLLVKQAMMDWPDSAVAQVIAEAGCLLKNRLAAGKETPVFAILTNGLDYCFFAIDTDGVVYASKRYILELGHDLTYHSSSSLKEILRWFAWFIVATESVTPGEASKNVTPKTIKDSLAKLKTCFGPKNPVTLGADQEINLSVLEKQLAELQTQAKQLSEHTTQDPKIMEVLSNIQYLIEAIKSANIVVSMLKRGK